MKIVFDSLVFALHRYGGVTTYWNEFIERFKREKFDLLILTVPWNRYLNTEFVELAKTQVNHIPERGWPLQLLRNTPPRIIGNHEKFIFHSTYLRVSNHKNAVNVVTIHDFTHQYFVKGFKQRLNYFQKKRAIRDSHGIVCISENTRKDLFEFFPEAKTKVVKVIYNGCSQVYLDPIPGERPANIPTPYILFVGARGGYKNFEFAINVLKNSAYHLVVAGSQFTEQEGELLEPFKNRISLFNNVSDEKLKTLYQHAHAFLYPSLYEGFGIPLLESMNCKCPVIAFKNSCIPEIMGDSPLLLQNNDLAATLHVLLKLESPQYRELVITTQNEQVRKFSWSRAFSEMKEFYKELMLTQGAR